MCQYLQKLIILGIYRLVVFVRNCSHSAWQRYANTEIVQVILAKNCPPGYEHYEPISQGSCNPVFMVSIGFRMEHGINEKTQVFLENKNLLMFKLTNFLSFRSKSVHYFYENCLQ